MGEGCGAALFFIGMWLAVVGLFSWLFTLAWGWLAVGIFGLPAMPFWVAFVIILVLGFVFK